MFGKVGWIGGYALDYGIGSSGGTGVTEVRTRVDQFRKSRGAKKGLAFRNLNDRAATRWAGGGLTITDIALPLPRVGSRHFAYLVGYSGRLHAKPVNLPKQKPGPPPGGPDLSPLALQTTDISGQSTQFAHNYVVGGPLSEFAVSERPTSTPLSSAGIRSI